MLLQFNNYYPANSGVRLCFQFYQPYTFLEEI
ncbi:hypothetical protein SAMN05428947_101673 [Mucilaginibacter sp. OK283]|nr:hypothetical protein SAMN05428947_101673 [Mucilaginibacter sp. OK283]